MTSFLDALTAEKSAHRKGPTCGVGRVLADLDKADAAQLQAALDDTSVMHAMIARALKAVGYPVPAETVGRHRKGECNCGKP